MGFNYNNIAKKNEKYECMDSTNGINTIWAPK